jgi:hypothetical protein
MTESNKIDANKHGDEDQLQEAIEQLLPTKLTRRDTLALFSGFDQNANRKLLGAVFEYLK